MRRLLLLLAALLPAQAPPPITFDDVTASSRLRFRMDASPTARKHQPEGLVSGVALLDYDNDGFLDVYFVNGAAMPSLVKQGPRHANRLFHNNHDGTFTDVTEKAGLAGAGFGMGVASADYDNDGFADLFLANVNANQLFRNNHDGTFSDVTAKAGLSGASFQGRKMWAVAAAFLDYDNDGLLDLFVSNYCVWDPATEPNCVANGIRQFCSPRHYKPLPHSLFRNNGNGTFTDVSASTGIAAHPGRGMGVALADYDNDGFLDIFVANDDTPFQLFHNLAGKRFEEVAKSVDTAYSENGNVISGMGADFRDLFNKNRPSLWVTAIEKETFPLFSNTGNGQFEDRTSSAGLTLQTYEMSGWSNAIADLDNDGWKDLIVARSNVNDNSHTYSSRQPAEPVSVFRNLANGRFQNVSASAGAALQTTALHRGLALGDLDNDGRLDAALSVLNGDARLLRNTSPAGHFLLVHLTGSRSNRSAIGARLRLTTPDGLSRFNHNSPSTGYGCSSDPRVHFGLGSATRAAELEILWPSGARQILKDIPADQVLHLSEPPSPAPR